MTLDPSASAHARALAARRQIVPGRCPRCGRAFTGTRKRRWCSDHCRSLASQQRRRVAAKHSNA